MTHATHIPCLTVVDAGIPATSTPGKLKDCSNERYAHQDQLRAPVGCIFSLVDSRRIMHTRIIVCAIPWVVKAPQMPRVAQRLRLLNRRRPIFEQVEAVRDQGVSEGGFAVINAIGVLARLRARRINWARDDDRGTERLP